MSRKLDALVAEKVFGWPIEWWVNDDGSRDNDAFRYSTDPVAMMQVLGKIGDWPATKAERVPLWTVTDTKDKDTWVWRVRLMMNGGLMWTAHHETLPLAVCLAALRWKGVSEDEIQEALR